jgi:hypothetical protein
MMLNADVWSLAMVILQVCQIVVQQGKPTQMMLPQIFTHKAPFENIAVRHGLVAFIVQGATPAHPSEDPDVPASTIPTKRKRTREPPIATSILATPGAVNTTAADLSPGEETHNAVSRGLTTEMWSLLQWCWEHDPRARPTIDVVTQRLKEIAENCSVGIKNITACVRKKTIYPIAMGGQCDVSLDSNLPEFTLSPRMTDISGRVCYPPARKGCHEATADVW